MSETGEYLAQRITEPKILEYLPWWVAVALILFISIMAALGIYKRMTRKGK